MCGTDNVSVAGHLIPHCSHLFSFSFSLYSIVSFTTHRADAAPWITESLRLIYLRDETVLLFKCISFSFYHPPPPPPFLFDSPAPPSVCAASSPFYASGDLLPLGRFSSFSLFSTCIPTLTILIVCTVLASLFSTKRLVLKVLPSGKLTLFSRCI